MPLHLEEIKTEWSYSSTPLYTFMGWTAINLPLVKRMKKDVDMFCKDGRSSGKFTTRIGRK